MDAALASLLSDLEQAAASAKVHSPAEVQAPYCRVITLLADGVDLLASRHALQRGWEVAAPLPFGFALNLAVNAQVADADEARAILKGEAAADPQTRARAQAIRDLAVQAKLFELADEDEALEPLFLASLEKPDDPSTVGAFLHEGSRRAALAGRILIEQSDVLIAVWDGVHTANQGGTGHTAMLALEAGVPVIWIDPSSPSSHRILRTPEALASALQTSPDEQEQTALADLAADSIGLSPPDAEGKFAGLATLTDGAWRAKSRFGSHAFRRIEAIFGSESFGQRFASVRQTYEAPSEIAEGSGASLLAAMRALGPDDEVADDVAQNILPRFAFAEGIAARLSNLYRSGMVINFLLGAMAIIAGVLYLPLVETSQKWIFAAIELTLLLVIVGNTLVGRRARFHGRWLETRRAAEYLRHLPLMLAIGVARPVGAWPSGLLGGVRSEWPEWYSRQVMRRSGLPAVRIDKAYLREAAQMIRENFITPQREYHHKKAERLHRAHHAIERFAERMFALAVLVVATYLTAFGASQLGFFPSDLVDGVAKWFTVIALALPTISGAFAAIGYFGDFDRFADISEVTAERLARLEERMTRFESLPDERLNYAHLAELARMTDQASFDEIQSWQAVFSGKRTTVPA